MSQRTRQAYKRTLLKECVRLCSPTGNVRQNVRLAAKKWPACWLSEFENVRLCSRTNEQMFAVRLCNPSDRSFVERFAEEGQREAPRIRRRKAVPARGQANVKQRDFVAAISAVVAARAEAS